jgi:hypothetical protein
MSELFGELRSDMDPYDITLHLSNMGLRENPNTGIDELRFTSIEGN